jgi:hypothetical protein
MPAWAFSMALPVLRQAGRHYQKADKNSIFDLLFVRCR